MGAMILASMTGCSITKKNQIEPVDGVPTAVVVVDNSRFPNKFAYNAIDFQHQKVYDEIYDCVTNHEKSIITSTNDSKILSEAFNAMIADNGAMFWVKNYESIEKVDMDEITSLEFKPVYTKTEDEIENYSKQMEEKRDEIISLIPDNADDYEKVKFLYTYLAENLSFIGCSDDGADLLSVFLNGQIDARGYANAMQYLLEGAGVQSGVVTGTANGTNHAWNVVGMDGYYYYVDVAWAARGDMVNYTYLGMSDNDTKLTHQTKVDFVLPNCLATEDNYFKREHRIVTNKNSDIVEDIFQSAIDSGDEIMSIKFMDADKYDWFVENYVDSDEKETYNGKEIISTNTTDSLLNTITIKLE